MNLMSRNVVQIEAPKLHRWQMDFCRLLDRDQYEDLDTQRIYVIKSPRQVGKSFLVSMLMIRQSINYRQSRTWYVSPTLGQARKLFREMADMLEGLPCIKSLNRSELIIFFTNKSEIHFGSCEQGDALRGNTVKYRGLLIIDEAAFQDDGFMSGTLFPYCNVYRRPIIMVSTPLFREGLFHDLFVKDDPHIRAFDVSEYDLSYFITDQQKALYKSTMATQKYMSEIMGEFIVASSEVFGDFSKVINSRKLISGVRNTYYIGIDWGSGVEGDSTAIAVFNGYKQMVDLKYFNDLEATETIEEVAKVIEYYGRRSTDEVRRIVVEKNSIGEVFLQLLRKRLPKRSIIPFNTTNETKNKIINHLQVAIQNNDIMLLDDKQLKYQFASYQLDKTKGGKITFNAKSGSHDDIVMATAIAYYQIRKGEYEIK